MGRARNKILACLVILFGVTSILLAGGQMATIRSSNEDMQEIEALLKTAINSEPVSPYDWKEPIDYLRPRTNADGDISEIVVGYDIKNSDIGASGAKLELVLIFEECETSSENNVSRFPITAWFEKRDGK